MLKSITVKNYMGINKQSFVTQMFGESLSFFVESDSEYNYSHTSKLPLSCTSLAFAVFDSSLHSVSPSQVLRSARAYKNIYVDHNSPVELSLNFEFDEVPVNYSYTKDDASLTLSERVTVDGKVVFEYERSTGMITHLDIEGTENLQRDLSGNKSIRPLSYVFNNSILRDSKEEVAFTNLHNWITGLALLSPYSEPNSIRNGYCNEAQDALDNIHRYTKNSNELQEFLLAFKNVLKEKVGHRVKVVEDGSNDLVVESFSGSSRSGFHVLTDKNIYLVRLYAMLVDPRIKTVILDDVKRAFNDNSDLMTLLDRVVGDKFPDKKLIFIS